MAGVLNVKLKLWPGASPPESKLLRKYPASAVTVWILVPVLVQVTIWPAWTVRLAGWNPSVSFRVTETFGATAGATPACGGPGWTTVTVYGPQSKPATLLPFRQSVADV